MIIKVIILWLLAQPIFVVGWAWLMRGRRRTGGN